MSVSKTGPNPAHPIVAPGIFRVEAMDLSGHSTATMVSKAIPQRACARVSIPDASVEHDAPASAGADATLSAGADATPSRGPDAARSSDDIDSGCSCRFGKRHNDARGAAAGVFLTLAVLLNRSIRRRGRYRSAN